MEAVIGIPERRQAPGRQRQLDHDIAERAGFHRVARVVDDLHVIAGEGNRRGTVFYRQEAETQWIAGNGPSCFGLPPVIDDWDLQRPFRPADRVRVGPLAREIKGPEPRQVVTARMGRFGSSLRIARSAVGAVNMTATPCSEMTRQ